MEPEIRYTTTEDGASIAFATMGNGPVVIIPPQIHSFGGRLRRNPGFRALCEALTDHYTVVLYDARGMGLSSRETRQYGIDARLIDLSAVISAAAAGSFALYGFSYGALVAIAYASRKPERLACLALVDAFATGSRYYRESPTGRVNDALGPVTSDQWRFVSETIAARVVPEDATPEDRANHAASLRESWDPVDFLAHREAVRAIDVSRDLAAISVPTLVAYTGSFGAVFEHTREIASGVANARLLRANGRWTGWDERDYAALIEFLTEHMPPAAPVAIARTNAGSGVRTVLFTDLVGHTEMMQRLGDARGREVLREHERITRETLAAHGGREIKTDGDSFMVSFGSVASAVECAIALQRAFAARVGEPLHVRMGLNAGEPIDDGGDLFGATVILAARIKDQADAGEILVPETVRGLVSGKGFIFADRGQFVPKGFEDGVRLYEVRWRE